MTEINKVSSNNFNVNDEQQKQEATKEIRLEDISLLYTTTKQEEQRSTFADSYAQVDKESTSHGKKFLNALIDNKQDLMQRLGLNDEQYDSLACTALALASQETGMGEENGYESENQGLGKFFRDIGKWFSTTFAGDASASSGLTQMKIYDFMHGNKLSDELKQVMKDYGIEANGKNSNNLFDNPDKAAIATMVVLKSINDNYGNYKNTLDTEHERIGNELALTPEEKEEKLKQGTELLNNILSVYNNAPADQKTALRETFKNWLLAKNGTKLNPMNDNDQYNEESQQLLFEVLLRKNNSDIKLDNNSLNLIRYVLTENSSEMSHIEYMAYGWNKGTTGTGMQLDRMLAEKVGTLMQNPEDLDYDQFTTNVATMAARYANQSVGYRASDILDDVFS